MVAEREEGLRLLVFAPPEADGDTFTPRVADACRQAADEGPGRSLALVGIEPDRGKSPRFVETFRLLAANVKQMAAGGGLQSILVMSAYPGEGRTLTVHNLGQALAELGQRVVIVETSPTNGRPNGHLNGGSRKPARNGAENGGNGLGVHLPSSDTRGPDSVLRTTVSLAGRGAGSIAQILTALRPLADFVVIDSPPCLHSADSFLLAPVVDGVIYVVRRRRQSAVEQREIQAQLARLGARVLGAVFNEP